MRYFAGSGLTQDQANQAYQQAQTKYGNPTAGSSYWSGGSKNFNESTGQYQQPATGGAKVSAYGQAQPKQPQSQGTPYSAYAPKYGPGTSQEYMASNPDTKPFGGQSPGYSSGYPAQKPSPPQGGPQGKPGQARPMRPQSGGTPYAPAARPSIGGWADPTGGGQRPFSRYAQGADMTAMPYTDTLEPNPLYHGSGPQMHDSNGNGVDDRLERMGLGGGVQAPARPYGNQPDPFTFGFSGGQPTTTAPSVQKGAGAGNLAYASPENRPQPFTQSINFMGQQMDPSQYYGQRDAFIQNINQARQPFAMNPTPQGQQLNFGGMWNQAGDMVANGWQNPLRGLYQ